MEREKGPAHRPPAAGRAGGFASRRELWAEHINHIIEWSSKKKPFGTSCGFLLLNPLALANRKEVIS